MGYAVIHGHPIVRNVTVHVSSFPAWAIVAIVVGAVILLLLLVAAVAAPRGGGMFHRRTVISSAPPSRVAGRTEVIEDEFV